jgi:hypothetical protein
MGLTVNRNHTVTTTGPDPEVLPVEVGEPSAESAASGRCAKCKGELPADAHRCPACGVWAPANGAALRHGGRSTRVRQALLPEQAETLARLAERRTAIEADLGGAEALSEISRDLVARYLETSTIAEYLAGVLVANGPLTARGRARSALSAYLQVLDRQHRLALALGVERKARHLNVAERLAQFHDSESPV